jgi:hypothetical protein
MNITLDEISVLTMELEAALYVFFGQRTS